MKNLFFLSLLLIPAQLSAAGLSGLKRGAMQATTSPKQLQFEQDVFDLIQKHRRDKHNHEVARDEQLSQFMRVKSKAAAKAETHIKDIETSIKHLKLAADGHAVFLSFGDTPESVFARIQSNAAIDQDFDRLGIGAFWVPEEKPYYQVGILLVQDPDPLRGQPGLSRDQSDPIIHKATDVLREKCYDPLLSQNPNAGGTTIFRLVITGTGSVGSVGEIRALGYPSFDACALKILKSLLFPKPRKNQAVILRQPIRFTPPQGDKRIGKLEPEAINKALGKARIQVQRCYDNALKSKAKLQGRITAAFRISPTGSVRQNQLIETMGHKKLESCVKDSLNATRFQKPKFNGWVDVTYPFEFKAPLTEQ